MARWAEVISTNCVRVVISGSIPTLTTAGEWIPAYDLVDVGWTWVDPVWTGPNGQTETSLPASSQRPRYLLVGAEWVATFTDDEWDWIDVQRNTEPRTPAIKELRKLMDAIRWTDSVNVASTNMDPFYNWLLNNGIPGGQTRIDELRQGILE